MKNNLKLILLLSFSLVFASCQNSISVLLEGKKVSFQKSELINIKKMTPEEADAEAILSINEALLSVAGEIKPLSAKLTILKESSKGILAFSIDSEMERVLKIEIFDEESYSMIGTDNLNIKKGINHLALNVKEYDNGTYIFRLRDFQNKEEKILPFKVKN